MVGVDEHAFAAGYDFCGSGLAFQCGEEDFVGAGEDGVGAVLDAELLQGGVAGEMLGFAEEGEEVGDHGGGGAGVEFVGGFVGGVGGGVRSCCSRMVPVRRSRR